MKKKSMKINLDHFDFKETPKTLVPKYQQMYEEFKAKTVKSRTEFETDYINFYEAEIAKGPPMKLEVLHKGTKVSKSWDSVESKVNKADMAKEVISLINKKRKDSRVLKGETKKFDGAEYETFGGSFTAERAKAVLEIGKSISKNDPWKPKTPKAANVSYVGVELEFIKLPGQTIKTIGKAFQDAGLSKYVEVSEDISCGFEVKILVTEIDFMEPISKITGVLKTMGFNVDARCGLHVHLDMRYRDHKVCYKNLFKAQGLLQKLVNPERVLKNKYCVENEFSSFDEHVNHPWVNIDSARRHAINPMAYSKHKTLEIRTLEGTLETDVICNWIKLLLKIVNYKQELPRNISTLVAADNLFKFDVELKKGLRAKMPKRA